MSMTSARVWLGFRKSQLPGAQYFLQLSIPSETATLLSVSNTTRPFGWSSTHMLTGMVMSRALSTGRAGIRPRMSNGPNMPLVVQYSFCANVADEPKVHSRPSSVAARTDFFMVLTPPVLMVIRVPTRTADFSLPKHLRTGNSGPPFQFDVQVLCLRYGACGVCLFGFRASIRVAAWRSERIFLTKKENGKKR